MRDQLALGFMKLLGLTPLRFNQWLGSQLGKVAWRASSKIRHITLTNLGLCFPGLSEKERIDLGKQSTQSMLETLVESPRLWKLAPEKLKALCINPESFDILKQAIEENNGLIIAAPHMGSWEYVGLYLGLHFPTTSLYRPPRMQTIDQFMRSGRSHTGATLAPTNSSGIKLLTRALRNNECIGLLPDQEATRGNGVYADFFGIPAYTMHLLPRMAQKKQSPVFFIFAERLQNGKFRFHIQKNYKAIYDKDAELACSSMNKSVEELVKTSPEQYNWNYKRFSLSPHGEKRY